MSDTRALTAIRHDYASVKSVRLRYARAADGPLILFLHCFPEFWYCWKRQLEDFGRDHLAAAPDVRGFNRFFLGFAKFLVAATARRLRRQAEAAFSCRPRSPAAYR